jgi:hypothetical protein
MLGRGDNMELIQLLLEADASKKQQLITKKDFAGKKPYDLAKDGEVKKLLFDVHNTLVMG